MRILRISWVDIVSNRSWIEGAFQLARLGSIKSLTRRAGRFLLRGNFGSSLKDGIVGTQFKDQIGVEEVLETFRLAHADINGLIFMILFQSQEVEVEIVEEMKSPYLIYLF
jgi:hypothetical protein